jgi:hypothetical protein
MINNNWTRWIIASCSGFFDDRKQNVPFFIEGQERPFQQEADLAEFRVNGPFYKEETKGKFRITLQVNILIRSIKDEDNHKIFRLCGIFETAFEQCIPVYKFGNRPEDNSNELLGNLYLIKNGDEDVVTNHFGQVSPEVKVLESTVEGYYRMRLET